MKPRPNRLRYNAKNATLLDNLEPKLQIQNRPGNLCSQLYTPHLQSPTMRLLRLHLRLKRHINPFRLLAMRLASNSAPPPQVQLTHSHFPHMSLAPHPDSFAAHPHHSSSTPVSPSTLLISSSKPSPAPTPTPTLQTGLTLRLLRLAVPHRVIICIRWICLQLLRPALRSRHGSLKVRW